MRAFVLGGSGLVGRAISRRLLSAGWDVDIVGRDAARLPIDLVEQGVGFTAADRSDTSAVGAAFGGGADLLVDCVCYTAKHALDLVALADAAGSTVMISSKAVYADAAGRRGDTPTLPNRRASTARCPSPSLPSRRATWTSTAGRGMARTRWRPSTCCWTAGCR